MNPEYPSSEGQGQDMGRKGGRVGSLREESDASVPDSLFCNSQTTPRAELSAEDLATLRAQVAESGASIGLRAADRARVTSNDDESGISEARRNETSERTGVDRDAQIAAKLDAENARAAIAEADAASISRAYREQVARQKLIDVPGAAAAKAHLRAIQDKTNDLR